MRAIMAHTIMASWLAGRCSYSRTVRRVIQVPTGESASAPLSSAIDSRKMPGRSG
jgi:hypothetical protein